MERAIAGSAESLKGRWMFHTGLEEKGSASTSLWKELVQGGEGGNGSECLMDTEF